MVLDDVLPDHSPESLAGELRALHADLPLLVTSSERAAELSQHFGTDRCTTVLARPYAGSQLQAALKTLGVLCRTR